MSSVWKAVSRCIAMTNGQNTGHRALHIQALPELSIGLRLAYPFRVGIVCRNETLLHWSRKRQLVGPGAGTSYSTMHNHVTRLIRAMTLGLFGIDTKHPFDHYGLRGIRCGSERWIGNTMLG